MGQRAALTSDVLIEREFGSKSFLDLYSDYVSKRIVELLEKEKCVNDGSIQDSSEHKKF